MSLVVQDQEDYNRRYKALVERYDMAKERLEGIGFEISAKEAKRTRMDEFIKALRKQDDIITEFDRTLWSGLVEHVTITREKAMVF